MKKFDCEICKSPDNGGGIGGWSVHTKLWNKVMFKYTDQKSSGGIAKGMLCINCFEKRLGRHLRYDDFTNTIDNQTNKYVQKLK